MTQPSTDSNLPRTLLDLFRTHQEGGFNRSERFSTHERKKKLIKTQIAHEERVRECNPNFSCARSKMRSVRNCVGLEVFMVKSSKKTKRGRMDFGFRLLSLWASDIIRVGPSLLWPTIPHNHKVYIVILYLYMKYFASRPNTYKLNIKLS